ncbi:MAG: ribokinase [Firmicutes bacterium]|nr:ribokinase [Bacillota bacterium]
MKKILVIGSLNTDFSINVNKIPLPGETVNAQNLLISNGGKGANQAYTIGKLRGNVTMLGIVGTDIYGKDLIDSLKKVGVNTEFIKESNRNETGKAFIYVNPEGENCITIIHGANYLVDSHFILEHQKLIEEADIILIQLEIPLDTIQTILSLAQGKMILLDPAPANKELMNLDLTNVYLIKPNETELQTLTSMPTDTIEHTVIAAQSLIAKGIKNVIVSLGSKGSLLVSQKEAYLIDALPVKAIDTTAAGDSFIASIALKLSMGETLIEAIKFATKVASIVVTQKGAQAAIPELEDIR